MRVRCGEADETKVRILTIKKCATGVPWSYLSGLTVCLSATLRHDTLFRPLIFSVPHRIFLSDTRLNASFAGLSTNDLSFVELKRESSTADTEGEKKRVPS